LQSRQTVHGSSNICTHRGGFRQLQRLANPIGLTLFSVIAEQHAAMLKWLSALSFVDPARIGFYGLSYGGKAAMRLPALLPHYACSICSADFNDWIGKNASTAFQGAGRI
jgi:dipeptidyl aminopeptidase/acylaminoacyl peptidase